MAYVIRDKVEDKKELKASFKAAQRVYKDDYRATMCYKKPCRTSRRDFILLGYNLYN
jgi:hypothetical protein